MRLSAVATLGAAFLAVGCSGPVLMNDYNGGIEMFFAHAAGGKDLRAVIVGNPFQVPKAETDASTIAAMQGRFRGPPTNLTTSPSQNTHPQARVFIVFDPSLGLHPPSVCKVRNPETLPRMAPTDRLRVLVTFCEGDYIYSEVQGSIPRPTSPADPAFSDLMSQAAFLLVPDDKTLDRDRGSDPVVR